MPDDPFFLTPLALIMTTGLSEHSSPVASVRRSGHAWPQQSARKTSQHNRPIA